MDIHKDCYSAINLTRQDGPHRRKTQQRNPLVKLSDQPYGWSNNANVGGFNVSNANLTGGFVGGTLGTNWQMGMVVLGLEADGVWSGINGTETNFIFGVPVTLKDQIQGFGSITGRFGFAVPNIMVYGKGGYAFIDNEISGSSPFATVSESHFHNGWTLGGGVEFAFAGP